MISYRYHIVSIVAVFLALAVGVALGGGPLQGKVDNTLVDQVASDRQAKTRLQADVTVLHSTDSFHDDFARTAAPALIGSALKGHVVTLVVLPSAPAADIKALRSLIGVAGASVGGTLRVSTRLVDVGNKQLVDELGNQLESRAPNLGIPTGASAYERMGALVARAIGTTRRGGATVDAAATTILAGLDTASLMSSEGTVRRRGDLVLFVTGDGQGSVDARKAAATIVTTLVHSVDSRTTGTVLAGPTASARAGGQLKALRDDVAAAKDVSTVDSLDRTAGQVVAVMALAGQAAGRTGQYGAVDAADGALPGARGATH